jgi:predicted HicB family RNase H-like nuclease
MQSRKETRTIAGDDRHIQYKPAINILRELVQGTSSGCSAIVADG